MEPVMSITGIVSHSGDPASTSDHLLTVSTTTSRDIAKFSSSVGSEDVNIEVESSSSADSSAGIFLHRSDPQNGAAWSLGQVGGVAEMSFGIGSAPNGFIYDVNTGTDIKLVIAEDAPSIYARAAGWGFGADSPAKLFHITEDNSRTSSSDTILRIHAKTDQDMTNGYGGVMDFAVQDNAAGPNVIANIAAFVTFSADDSGALQFNVANGGTLSRGLQIDPNLLVTVPGDVDAQGNIKLNNDTLGAAEADKCLLTSVDLSAGNTILALRTEGSGIESAGSATIDRTIAMDINGTVRHLMASDTPAA